MFNRFKGSVDFALKGSRFQERRSAVKLTFDAVCDKRQRGSVAGKQEIAVSTWLPAWC